MRKILAEWRKYLAEDAPLSTLQPSDIPQSTITDVKKRAIAFLGGRLRAAGDQVTGAAVAKLKQAKTTRKPAVVKKAPATFTREEQVGIARATLRAFREFNLYLEQTINIKGQKISLAAVLGITLGKKVEINSLELNIDNGILKGFNVSGNFGPHLKLKGYQVGFNKPIKIGSREVLVGLEYSKDILANMEEIEQLGGKLEIPLGQYVTLKLHARAEIGSGAVTGGGVAFDVSGLGLPKGSQVTFRGDATKTPGAADRDWGAAVGLNIPFE